MESEDLKHQDQSFAKEILALTSRANGFETLAQVALEQEAAVRAELFETSQELVRLRELSEKLRVEKAKAELELENIRFCKDVKEGEKGKIEAANNATEQGLQATIDNLRDRWERHLREIPDDLCERD